MAFKLEVSSSDPCKGGQMDSLFENMERTAEPVYLSQRSWKWELQEVQQLLWGRLSW